MSDPGPRPAAGVPPQFDREVSVRGITAFVVGLAAVSLVAFLWMWSLAVRAKLGLIAKDPAPSPMPEANQPRPRPAVALQADPNGDMARFRAQEEAALATYAWVDREAGVARIPVDRAIELVAEQGLPQPAPATPAAPAPPASPAAPAAPAAAKGGTR